MGLLAQLAPRRLGRALWETRANFDHAWRLLRRGSCDACGFGSRGLADWTLPGVHACAGRLESLADFTRPALDLRELADASSLAGCTAAELRSRGRLTVPLLRRAGERGFRRIAWEEALDLCGERLRVANPERVCLRVDPRGQSNETLYLAQKLIRFLGSPHVSSTADVSSALAGYERALGLTAATATARDWCDAELIVLVGAQVRATHPHADRLVEAALRTPLPDRKRSKALLVVGEAPYAPHPGEELAFFAAVMKTLLAKDGVARHYVDAHVDDFDDLARTLASLELDTLTARCGVSREAVFEFAAALCRARSVVFAWTADDAGCSPQAANAVVDLALLRGLVGQPGSGLTPLVESPGAHAALDLGVVASRLPGAKLAGDAAARLSQLYGFAVPDRPGHSHRALLAAAGASEVELLYLVGEGACDAEALSRVPWRVHQATFLSPAALAPSAEATLLLPARAPHEQRGGSCTTSAERRVAFTRRIPGGAPGEARSGWRILAEVGSRAHPQRAAQLAAPHARTVRAEIAQVVSSYAGLEHLRRNGDFLCAHGETACAHSRFPTRNGRARFGGLELS